MDGGTGKSRRLPSFQAENNKSRPTILPRLVSAEVTNETRIYAISRSSAIGIRHFRCGTLATEKLAVIYGILYAPLA